LPQFGYAAINFNHTKTFNIPYEQRAGINSKFAERVRSVIKQLKPTHVLVCGEDAFHFIFPKIENYHWKKGWVFNLGEEERRIKIATHA
jgi:hypothetical protein